MSTEEPSLLAELTLRLARSPEDVATEGLASILRRFPASAAVVGSMLAELARTKLPAIAVFRSQVSGDDSSRPDLEAHDASGHPVAIFESKFWAGLTEAQPNLYLQRLKTTRGVLCFIAPSSRIPVLWIELLHRARLGDEVNSVRDEAELKLAHVGEHVSLAVMSWDLLLGRLRDALEADGRIGLVADVRQLVSLTRRLDTEGFIPLTATDLTGAVARRVIDYCDLVNVVMNALRPLTFVDKKGLTVARGMGVYGHYFRIHRFNALIQFSAWMWRYHGQSPLWLRLQGRVENKFSGEVELEIVDEFGRESSVSTQTGDPGDIGVWIPLPLAEGREKEFVVDSIVRRITRVAMRLERIVEPQVEIPQKPS